MNVNSDKEDDSPHEISISREYDCAEIPGIADEDIVRAIELTASTHNCLSCQISVVLVDDARMTELHGKYMDIHEPTDVLSFDLSEHGASGIDGEIIVCVDTALRESSRRGGNLLGELLLYVIHGTLHLLGYDDHEQEAYERMHAKEDQLLTQLGIGPIFGEKTL